MTEIEKMYENAGIKKKPYCELNCSITKNDFECTSYCLHYEDEGLYYPPFTAEKQIEVIKWLGELDMLEIMRTTREDRAWIINSEYGMSGNVYKHTSRMKSFEEALASLVNNLWQDLTEAEKAQVKEILE